MSQNYSVQVYTVIFPTHRQTDAKTMLRATSVAIGRIYALRACDTA